MKYPHGIRSGLCAFAAAALLAGCSTTASRIEKNSALFTGLDAADQEAIRNGEVTIGFTPDMVYLALGHADRKYTRQVADGEREVWSYTGYDYQNDRQLVRNRMPVRDRKGNLRYPNTSTWVDVRNRVEYERIRVEFDAGKVTAIERMQQP